MLIDIDTRMSQIDKILEFEITGRSSFFQLQHFVIGIQPTTQSQMWQCLRELKTKKEASKHLLLDIDEMKDNIILAEIELEKTKKIDVIDSLDKKEKDIHIRKTERRINASKEALVGLEKRLNEELEESSFYIKAFLHLNDQEPLKKFDDPSAQREYWNAKLSQDLNLSLLLRRPISTETAKSILSLNDEAPIKKQLINIIDQMKLTDEQHVNYPSQKGRGL
jgi:hypothetical protein